MPSTNAITTSGLHYKEKVVNGYIYVFNTPTKCTYTIKYINDHLFILHVSPFIAPSSGRTFLACSKLLLHFGITSVRNFCTITETRTRIYTQQQHHIRQGAIAKVLYLSESIKLERNKEHILPQNCKKKKK